jgi:hypothetical protein
MANSVLVMHFLEPLERTAKLGCHDLDVLGDVAILSSVRVHRFEDDDVASVHSPPALLTKGRERALLPQLSPMTLAIAEREMAFLTARKVAAHLGPKKRGERPTGVILCGMSSTVTT